MARGHLTREVNKIAKKMIGRTIDTTELRLIPYVQYVMVNEQKLDPAKINEEERHVLARWRREGFIEGGAGGLSVTEDFWNFMCAVLLESYVKG